MESQESQPSIKGQNNTDQKITAEELLTQLQEFLESLINTKFNEINIEGWVFKGRSGQAFGTPTGSWNAKEYPAYRFVSGDYDFLLRPVPIDPQGKYSYLVIESNANQWQLANLRLSEKKYKYSNRQYTLLDDYNMTVGHKRSMNEVEQVMLDMGFNPEGVISQFGAIKGIIPFRTLIFDILEWATYRERSKIAIRGGENLIDDVDEIFLIGKTNIRLVDRRNMKPIPGTNEIALEVADVLINLQNEPGMMVGLFGRWGRGKTYMVDRIWEQRNIQDHFIKIDFHAWKYQDTAASWAYLYEVLAKGFYDEFNNIFKKAGRVFMLNKNKMGSAKFWFSMAAITMVLLFVIIRISKDGMTAIVNLPEFEITNLEHWMLGLGSLFGMSLIPLIYFHRFWKTNESKAKQFVKKFTSKHSHGELLGIQAEIQKDLKILLQTWIKEPTIKGHKRILLFVDDIDRCSEDRIIQIVDAFRVMLEDPEVAKRVVVIAAIDERILSKAIYAKYNRFTQNSDDGFKLNVNVLVREYLDKLFLLGIKLGELVPKELGNVLDSLTEGKVRIDPNEKMLKDPKNSSEETYLNSEETTEELKVNDSWSDYKTKNQDFHIMNWEEGRLKKVLNDLGDMTPRQIRIFYFRYLLSREFIRNVFEHQWSASDSDALLSLLSPLSAEREIIVSASDKINEYLKNKGSNFSEYNSLEDKKKQDMKKVLEMVVAY